MTHPIKRDLLDIKIAVVDKIAPVSYTHLDVYKRQEQYHAVLERAPSAQYNALGRVIYLNREKVTRCGKVAVVTGGTADLPVAEEAALSAEFFGAEVERFTDVGIAGLHRLLSVIEDIRACNAVIAIAGMEGALPSVIAGLVDKPVIAVPTSVGYGASFQGLAPLLTMLNSCAEGITVVNICLLYTSRCV